MMILILLLWYDHMIINNTGFTTVILILIYLLFQPSNLRYPPAHPNYSSQAQNYSHPYRYNSAQRYDSW